MTTAYEAKKITGLRAIQDHVIVTDMNFAEKLSAGGIIIPSVDGKIEGVHPRWGRVYAVGQSQKDIKVGQYVLVKHGRWTRGSLIEDQTGPKTIRRIDVSDILLISDEPQQDENIGDGI